MVIFKWGLPPSPSSTPGKLSTAVWVRRTGLPSLDPVGTLTHPQQMSRRLRHCWDDEIVVERKVPLRNGELTEPMVDIVSQVTVDCLDPDGNIDKESRLVSTIR